MIRRTLFSFLILCSSLSFAEGTRTWFQSRYEDFEKGTAKGVAIRSDGMLELSPALKQIATTPSTYVWAVEADREGNAFVAAGSPARVYKVTPQGQITTVFEPQELQVQALLTARDGSLYAATSPDGKVYRITKAAVAPVAKGSEGDVSQSQTPQTEQGSVPKDNSYTASVYFDPKTKYIWALAEDNEGRLYVATGDRGEVYRVEKNGAGSVFFKSDEAHIRVVAIDPKGNLIAGSDGSGLIYRVSPSGDAFVLYSAPKKEITALAIDKEGNIFAAGAVEKRGGNFNGPMPTFAAPLPSSQAGGTITVGGQPQPQAVTVQAPSSPFAAAGGSEIYRIAPDGSPRRIWQSRDELVYALTFDQRGRLIAGTGNKGRLFVIGQDSFVDLGKAMANQVTGIVAAPNGGMYVVTSNLGKVFLFGGSPEADGTFESDVFDAKIFSRWGRAVVRGSGAFDLYARSGNVDNPDRNWSEWRKADLSRETPVDIPPARFVQWRAVLHPGTPAARLESVMVNYLPKNVAPEIEDVFVQPGAKFNSVSKSTSDTSVNVGPTPSGSSTRFESTPSATRDKDYIAVRWTASDDNDDDLVYSVYYKGDTETRWKLLKDNLAEKYYSFEASLLPDGGYTVMVVASDSPSHTPEEALSDSKQSDRFEVDTTPPQVTNVTGVIENDAIHVTFRAIDGFSPIARAEYSIDAGEWHTVEPVGQISDYRVENYDFTAALPLSDQSVGLEIATTGDSAAPAARPKKGRAVKAEPGQEHVIVVRVYDRFENMGSAKTVTRGR